MNKINQKKINTIQDLKNFLKDYFKNYDVKIYLFGSRAEGREKLYSDIDLAIETQEDIKQKIVLLKEILENSNLPYKVDVVNLKDAPYLKKTVKQKGKRWL